MAQILPIMKKMFVFGVIINFFSVFLFFFSFLWFGLVRFLFFSSVLFVLVFAEPNSVEEETRWALVCAFCFYCSQYLFVVCLNVLGFSLSLNCCEFCVFFGRRVGKSLKIVFVELFSNGFRIFQSGLKVLCG